MAKYTIGIDFGTLSVRAVVIAVEDGRVLANAAFDYPHAVMDKALPDGTPLDSDWALQHPQDYLEGIRHTVREAVTKSGVSADDVIAVGIDFTSSTSLPVDEKGEPLCLQSRFSSNPYAWPMLWKHHAARKYADRMTQAALEIGEAFLERCGGRISAEMMFPRLWQIAEEAPEVYEAADQFMEAGDWITRQLTGSRACSANPAGYKLFWTEEEGYPSQQFFRCWIQS